MQRKFQTFIISLLLCCLACHSLQAAEEQMQPQDDGIRLSLLTCGPGKEIYSLFGHTAIRYENRRKGIDVVFNYGLFSFQSSNFILRFTLGETDYRLGATEYKYFLSEYLLDNRDVWEQTLNLTTEEKQKLINQLEENYRPENRVYRYNFFYDNCATRPRDQVERAVNNSLRYSDDMTTTDTGRSFRDIVHQYCQGHPWSQFGIDLCLGSEADRPISRHQMMFAPFYLKDFFATATLADSTGIGTRPLVSQTEQPVVIPNEDKQTETTLFTPLLTATLLFLFVCACSWYGVRRQRSLWGIDLILFTVAGLSGCILAFLALFSSHPTVSSNYILFALHPLHLFCLPWMIKKVRKRQTCRYMQANFVVLTLFILLWAIIPQKINPTMLPLALCLLVRSASNLILSHKQGLRRRIKR